MSEPADPWHDSASPVGPGGPARPPTVRLATWVNVVLVLILFASCANNSENQSSDSGQVADEVVQRLGGDGADGTPGGLATRDDVRQMCHLLAQVAAKQGLKAAEIVAGDTPSACQDGVADAKP